MPDVPYILSDPEASEPPAAPFVISVTEDQLMEAIGVFVRRILPGIPIERGQLNRVPQPKASDYIIVNPRMRAHLSTTVHRPDLASRIVGVARSTRADVQFDFYGPGSTDNTQIFTTLMRDAFGVEAFAGTGVAPLYCNDGHQMPLVNGEAQYEDRWTVAASFQVTPAVQVPTEFMTQVRATPRLADLDTLAIPD